MALGVMFDALNSGENTCNKQVLDILKIICLNSKDDVFSYLIFTRDLFRKLN